MISLIIPTYNRAALLKRALESAIALDYPPDRYEIIAVDNGSADATPLTVREMQENNAKHALRYISEDRLGLHNARHAGARAARGDILVFTDDDATFDRGWLGAYAEAFDSHAEMIAAGGPVRPAWETRPPKWLTDFMGDAKTFGMFSLMEPYEEFHLDPQGVFFGVNMAIRRSALFELGGFNPEAFGDQWLGDGESGLNYKLWGRKLLVGYVPRALVYHHIPPQRMTVSYLRARMANQGACDLYSELHRGLPDVRWTLKRAAALLLRTAGNSLRAFLAKDRTDVGSLEVQLEAAYRQAQLKYLLKIAFDKRLQALVLKRDWLNDAFPMKESPTLQHR